MDVTLQGVQQVSEQPLVHGRPFELRDTEHGGARTRTELTPLLLCHRGPPETQVHVNVLLCMGGLTTMYTLRENESYTVVTVGTEGKTCNIDGQYFITIDLSSIIEVVSTHCECFVGILSPLPQLQRDVF